MLKQLRGKRSLECMQLIKGLFPESINNPPVQIDETKKNNVTEKRSRNSEALQRRRYANEQRIHGKGLNLVSHERNASGIPHAPPLHSHSTPLVGADTGKPTCETVAFSTKAKRVCA